MRGALTFRNRQTLEPVPFAQVSAQGRPVGEADQAGRLVLDLPGGTLLAVSSIGYRTEQFTFTGDALVNMDEKETALGPVVITRQDGNGAGLWLLLAFALVLYLGNDERR